MRMGDLSHGRFLGTLVTMWLQFVGNWLQPVADDVFTTEPQRTQNRHRDELKTK